MAVVLVVGGLIVLLFFGGVLFYGAPYLPTLRSQAETALELLSLEPGQTLLELGCGDGKVLLLAAQKGYRAVGIELNPLLALVAWWRTRRYRNQVRVVCANFWKESWPPEADAVFTFLLGKYMPTLDARMVQYGRPLASVAFAVPGRVPAKTKNGVFLYMYAPSSTYALLPTPSGA